MSNIVVCAVLTKCSSNRSVMYTYVPGLGSVGVLQCGGEGDGNDTHRSGYPNRDKKMFS